MRLAVFALAIAAVGLPTACKADELGNVWPLGDSLTAGQNSLGAVPGGWRDPFVTAMTSAGYQFQMVGTQTSNDTSNLDALGQQYHDGHSGFTVAQLDGDLGYWVAPGAYLPATGHNPNLILLMAGSSDTSRGQIAGAGDRLAGMISDIATDDPTAKIIVASIIPQYGGYEADREAYNAQVYADARAAAAAGLNVQFADVGESITSQSDMTDTLHPNAAGEQLLAQGWETAVTNPSALAAYPEQGGSPSQIDIAAAQTAHLTAGGGSGITVRTISGLTVLPGAVEVVDPASDHPNRQLLVITGTGLSLASQTSTPGGSLDLGNNDLDLPGGNLSLITSYAAAGYSNGTWSGPWGITSVSAAQDAAHLTAVGVILNDEPGGSVFSGSHQFDGVTPGGADVLVKYTYCGDANLDGVVDGSDYSLIDAGYANHLAGWYNGDFNYDGVVDGSDYALIDNAFNNQAGVVGPSALVASVTSQPAAVPEPAVSAVVAVVAGIAARHSRRKPRR